MNPKGNLVRNYLYHTERALDCCSQSRCRFGFPADLPEDVATRWRSELEREYTQRVCRVTEYQNSTPQSSNVVVGEPARANALLQKTTIVTPRPAEDLRPANPHLWGVRRLDVRPPMFQPTIRQIPLPLFPGELSPECITAMTVADNKVWVGVDTELVRRYIGGRDFNEYAKSAFLILDPKTHRFANISTRLGSHSRVGGFQLHDDRMWIAFSQDGVWSVDRAGTVIRQFTTRDGLLTDELYAIAQVGGRLYLGGGKSSGKLTSYDFSTATFRGEAIGAWMPREPAPCAIHRLAAWEHWLLVDAGQPLLFNTEQRHWTNLERLLFADSLRRQWGAYNDWPLNNTITSAVADKFGFWIGTEAGLAFFNPAKNEWKTMVTPYAPNDPTTGYWINPIRQFCRQPRALTKQQIVPAWPTTRLAGGVTALAIDRDYLWIATQTLQDDFCNSPEELEGCFIYLLHRPTRKWIGQFRVPHPVHMLAVAGDSLYAAVTDGCTARLIAIDRTKLLAVPPEHWLTDEIPETELTGRIAGLPRREQAQYAFFRGDYRHVAQILNAPDLRLADLATLFLLGHNYDPLGLNEPAKSRSYFEEIRARKPDRYSDAAVERALRGLP